MQKVAMSIASLLRLNGISTDIDLMGRKLQKQIENSTESLYCIIVAPAELEQGKVILKNMQDGIETHIEIEKLTNDPKFVLNLEKL